MINSVMNTQQTQVYATSKKPEVEKKTSEKKTSEKTKDTAEAKKAKQQEQLSAVYEKSTEKVKEDKEKAPYSINKMSKEDRAEMVKKLKEEQDLRKKELVKLAQNMIDKQASTHEIAKSEEDAIWKKFASGEYEVSEATKAKAKEEISEDGYWGVKQTSERLFDFASALAGDDVDKMKDMQKAVEEGFKQATKAWGKELPEISRETLEATNKLFEEYYADRI